MNAWLAFASALAGILSAMGVRDALKAFVSRKRPSDVERVKTLNEATLQWAEELREDAASARNELRNVRRETKEVVDNVSLELARVRRDLVTVEASVRRILVLIHHTPNMTIDRLRELVPESENELG